jgi:peptide/nickel transport system substrate-binding protein
VRRAIAHAIDKDTLVSRTLAGIGKPQDTLSVSPNPIWSPEIPAEERFAFDLAESRRILDAAGYRDTNGDGIREMPGGGQPLRFRYAVRSEGVTGASTAEFFSGWMREIGIGITQKVYDDSRLTEVIGQGDYDIFAWGWTPFVDPDQMLSYFTCSQVADDPENPTDYYNDANWCDREYDRLYAAQKVELDPERRVDLVHQMLRRFHDAAVYNVLYVYPDTQAWRKGRFTGFVQQPAETGPVIYSNTSPTYARLKPVSATTAAGGDDGGGSGALIAIAVVAVLAVGGAALLISRRRSADERE